MFPRELWGVGLMLIELALGWWANVAASAQTADLSWLSNLWGSLIWLCSRLKGWWLDADSHLVAVSQIVTAGAVTITVAVTARQGIDLLRANRDRAKTQASYDHIARQTYDRDLIQMFEDLRHVIKGLPSPIDVENGKLPVEVISEDGGKLELMAEVFIRRVLNHYEVTSIGINRDALDEGIIRQWWRTNFVRDIIDLQTWIIENRSRVGSSAVFRECCDLAYRWAKEDERKRFKPELFPDGFPARPTPKSKN